MTGKKTKFNLLDVLHYLMLAAGLAVIVWSGIKQHEHGLVREPTLDQLKELLTGGVAGGLVSSPVPHYPGSVGEGVNAKSAAAFTTVQLPPKIKGFVDEINVLAVLDKDGVIQSLKIIDDRETPYYMGLVKDSGLLDRLAGRDVRRGFKDVDAVTGATISSRAIIEDLSAAAAEEAQALYQIEVPGVQVMTWSSALKNPKVIVLIVVMGLSLYSRYGRYPRKYRREAVWLISIAALGFYLNTPYSLGHTFQLLALDLPGPANLSLALLAGFVIITTIVAGPLNCGFLCPFGGLQELLFKITPRRWHISAKVTHWAREIRFLTLFASVIGFFGFGISAFSQIEPFSHLFALHKDLLAWLFIGVILATSIFVPRFWCRFFCPTGACLTILSAHRKYLRSVQKGVEQANIDFPQGATETTQE